MSRNEGKVGGGGDPHLNLHSIPGFNSQILALFFNA